MLQGNEMVNRIRQAAESGDDMPQPGTPMGVVLHALADPSGESFDKRLAAELKTLRPDWYDGDALASPRAPGRR